MDGPSYPVEGLGSAKEAAFSLLTLHIYLVRDVNELDRVGFYLNRLDLVEKIELKSDLLYVKGFI